MAKGLEQIGDELYAMDPQGFIAARDEAADEAKARGDALLAKQIAKLRKPTVAAWVVNLLALKRPQAVGDLMELAELMREAQRTLKGDDLRKLAGQRRTVIRSLVDQAQKLSGLSASKLPLSDVEGTLTAALADEDIAELVRTGRLTKTVSYAGFGELPLSDAVPTPPAPSKEKEREREAARKALEKAQAELEEAEAAEQEAAQRVAGIEAQIDELEQQRVEARNSLQELRKAHKEAQRALTAANRRATQAGLE
ncbi:hypothetical protein [Allorhizocola rhizosphaerae]|uniref:hypothetical protein n=1 Tax=Allorhizocola rhizosphaerae TaxID=1872709 RepID=UPI000E3BF6D5|nr:hypothetical protein [Allorhizocola rhizosphaerae]